MKNLLLSLTALCFCSACEHEFEIDKEAIMYLVFDETSNWPLDLDKPWTTEAYEDWKYKIMKADSAKTIKPFFALKLHEDSVKVSLLPLTGFIERQTHKEQYDIEWAVIHGDKFDFLPSDYFDGTKDEIPISNLSTLIEARYNFSDSLNRKCPEWWVIGEQESDLISKQAFEEIVAGYLEFTKRKLSTSDKSTPLKALLKKHKQAFPFRISIEGPISRYGE